MGYLKHKTDLFIGVSELDKMSSFFRDEGYKLLLLKNSGSFGILKYGQDPNFNNFKVVEDVAGSGNFKIENDSYAIDSSGNIIKQKSFTGRSVTDNGAWYWVMVQHAFSSIEQGTVSIDINGNITGVGTKFTEVLRGAPNFPSKIKFNGSSKNLLEYDIVSVIDDTNAILAGTGFKAESDIKYQVVGTFTPGHVPTSVEKFPFQHDSCTLSLSPETVTNTPPSKTDGSQFYIARIKNVGGNLTIQDKRTEFWKSQGEFNLTNILKVANPLIGVESVKWKDASTVRDENLVNIGWGVRTTSWTLDAPSRTITLSTSSLNAGKYKSTSQFSDTELDGWRVYFKDGSYSEIHTSAVQGTSIQCTLKHIDPSKLSTGDELVIVPSVDNVELRARTVDAENTTVEKRKTFEASAGVGVLELSIPSSTYDYIVEYRYIKGGEATQWLQIPTDTDNGYYTESSFDAKGKLKDTPSRQVYTSSSTVGFIKLTRASDAYVEFISTIQTGDKYGYDTFELDNGSPIVAFGAGTDAFVQRCTGVRGESPFTTDHIIGLKNANAKVGNSFTLIFNVGINNAGFNLDIHTAYVSETDTGSRIKRFSEEDFDYPFLEGKAVILKCIYNGAAWECHVIEEDPHRIADIKLVGNLDIANFPQGKATIGTKHQGWALADGTNGTLNLADKFVVGFNKNGTATPTSNPGKNLNYGAIGNTGGEDAHLLTGLESGVQNHSHNYTWRKPTTQVNSGSGNNVADDSTETEATTDSGNADAKESHENRPSYIVVGYLQRIKYTA